MIEIWNGQNGKTYSALFTISKHIVGFVKTCLFNES